MDTWPKDIRASAMLVHTAHILLSGILPTMKQSTIWHHTHRSHIAESQKMMQTQLHLPLQNVKFFHQMKQEVEHISRSYDEIFEVETHE